MAERTVMPLFRFNQSVGSNSGLADHTKLVARRGERHSTIIIGFFFSFGKDVKPFSPVH